MSSRQRTRISKSVQEALNGVEDVIVAYVFGSTAKGKQHPFSDIDIAILLKEPSLDKFSRRLEQLDKQTQIRILEKPRTLEEKPFAGKRLTGHLTGRPQNNLPTLKKQCNNPNSRSQKDSLRIIDIRSAHNCLMFEIFGPRHAL